MSLSFSTLYLRKYLTNLFCTKKNILTQLWSRRNGRHCISKYIAPILLKYYYYIIYNVISFTDIKFDNIANSIEKCIGFLNTNTTMDTTMD